MKKSALKQYAETSARFVVAHASPRDSSAPDSTSAFVCQTSKV